MPRRTRRVERVKAACLRVCFPLSREGTSRPTVTQSTVELGHFGRTCPLGRCFAKWRQKGTRGPGGRATGRNAAFPSCAPVAYASTFESVKRGGKRFRRTFEVSSTDELNDAAGSLRLPFADCDTGSNGKSTVHVSQANERHAVRRLFASNHSAKMDSTFRSDVTSSRSSRALSLVFPFSRDCAIYVRRFVATSRFAVSSFFHFASFRPFPLPWSLPLRLASLSFA